MVPRTIAAQLLPDFEGHASTDIEWNDLNGSAN
jgi:hypothetical protein